MNFPVSNKGSACYSHLEQLINVADFFINPEMLLATHVHILPSCDVTSLKKT